MSHMTMTLATYVTIEGMNRVNQSMHGTLKKFLSTEGNAEVINPSSKKSLSMEKTVWNEK